jgi:hypothetical protein
VVSGVDDHRKARLCLKEVQFDSGPVDPSIRELSHGVVDMAHELTLEVADGRLLALLELDSDDESHDVFHRIHLYLLGLLSAP